jgi:hypothetical protein
MAKKRNFQKCKRSQFLAPIYEKRAEEEKSLTHL